MTRALRIGFLCAHDPYDRSSFSGTPSYMLDALQRLSGVDLRVLGPFRPVPFGAFGRRVMRRLRRWRGGIDILPSAHEMAGLDWIVVPVSSGLVARRPEGVTARFALVTDATPQFLRDFYGQTVPPEADATEAAAIRNADLVVYSSQYMADRALAEFGAEAADRVRAVSFGLNMDRLPPPPAPKPDPAPLRLLFVGRDWERKGGDIALAATEELNRRGIATRLTVIGVEPAAVRGHPFVDLPGYLDKNDPEDYRRLNEAFREAHFFILPTRADCTPMVVAEANAHGTPVLITDTGGIPSLVTPGANGVLMPPDADGAAYADRIAALIGDLPAWRAMCDSSYAYCRDNLTWDAWAQSLLVLMRRA